MNILVVDDEPSHCRSLSMGLRSEGFLVYQAFNAKEAINVIDVQAVDVALVDLMMPGISGLELCRVIKDSYPHIKVILVSAYHISERQVALSGTGAVAFLPKPYSMDRLISFLQEDLRESNGVEPIIL
ncbi:MAG: response regulator [Pseudomonadota bacterium]